MTGALGRAVTAVSPDGGPEQTQRAAGSRDEPTDSLRVRAMSGLGKFPGLGVRGPRRNLRR